MEVHRSHKSEVQVRVLPLQLPKREYEKKEEGFSMIEVSKEEAKWLESKGAKYRDILHKSIGVAGKVYMTQDPKWYKMLMQRRQSQIVESHTAK